MNVINSAPLGKMWHTLTVDHEFGREVHAYPVGDLQPHHLMQTCKCQPRIERAPGTLPLVIHNSYDGREIAESVTRPAD